MTYPESQVASTVSERFVPCQVNTQDGSADEIVARYRQVWTPDLRIVASDGFDLYHWNGYLPPYEFLPQLLLAEGHAYLRLHDEPRAGAVFADVVRRFPTSAVAPEAQYFAAVAKYKVSHEGGDLMGGWHQIRTRYPQSIWRQKQSFSEKG